MKDRVSVISFGLGGHCLNMENSVLTGYENPETFQNRIAAGDYTDYPMAGAVVIDKRAILDTNPGLAFRSPMVSGKLTGDQVNECPQPDPLFASALAHDPSNAFAGLLAMQTLHKIKSNEPGPLDSVSPSAYAAWWEANGARIGRMNASGKSIEWKDAASVAA